MPSRKKRLKKQLQSLYERLAEHYAKLEEDLDQGRFSISHHRQKIETLKRNIEEKQALFKKRKKNQNLTGSRK